MGVDVLFVTPVGASTAHGSGDSAPDAAVRPAPASGGDRPTTPASTVPARPRAAAATSAPTAPRLVRRVPERSEELRHMSLDRLRAYRRTLLSEELSTSYWRRLVQARRDLVRVGGPTADRETVRAALVEERGTGGRQAILALHPAQGMPILPNLPELWATEVAAPGTPHARELTTRLSSAESVLSSYREALHRRLDRANADLVARYHEDPRLCFVALPSRG